MKFGISGLAVVYLGADLSQEYYDRETDFGLALDKNLFPVVYDHGYDETVAKQRIGEGRLSREANGLRFTGTIEAPDKFAASLKRLIASGDLGFSTGAIGHMIERVKQSDGRTYLKSWHIGEVSCTTNNCEPRTYVALKKSLEEVKADVRERARTIKLNDIHRRARFNHYRYGLEHIIQAETFGFDSSSVKRVFDEESAALRHELEEVRK